MVQGELSASLNAQVDAALRSRTQRPTRSIDLGVFSFVKPESISSSSFPASTMWQRSIRVSSKAT